ncbi:MAG TPA: hypothetical protein VG347_17735 [Verrucomicrobiae bacterium]|nr:hypothetical protein [Verrucomicrobiae bacterium]
MKMLKFLLPMLSAVLLLSGCDGGSAPTASQTQSTNPADIDNPLVNAKRTADKTIDVSYINQAINLFNV